MTLSLPKLEEYYLRGEEELYGDVTFGEEELYNMKCHCHWNMHYYIQFGFHEHPQAGPV